MNERLTGPWARRPDVRVGAVVAVAIAVAFVVWLLVRGGDSNTAKPGATTGQAAGPEATTADKLRALSVELGHPIYWAGPLPNRTYELTRTSDDRIFIRYLPHGVPVGIRQAAFTIVGTYPVPNAYKVLQGLAKKPGESDVLRAGRRLRRLQHGAAEQRLPGLPRLERADRGLRPVAEAGARADHLGPGRGRQLAVSPARRLARLPAPAGGALARLRPAARGRER